MTIRRKPWKPVIGATYGATDFGQRLAYERNVGKEPAYYPELADQWSWPRAKRRKYNRKSIEDVC